MHIELVSQSKYRTGTRAGDDVPLIVPGRVYGVLDGATDARGTVVDGIGAGRLAALTVARDLADLAARPDIRDRPGDEIVRHLSDGLTRRMAPLNLPIPPSTTLAAAVDCGGCWRFLLHGDSAIRLNGTEVLRREKIIDAVSTAARVAAFAVFRDRLDDLDAVEYATRRALFLGFDQAVRDGDLTRAETEAFIQTAIAHTGLHDSADTIAGFLRGGLQIQYRYGNRTGSPLCFDTLNGTIPQLGHLIDVERPKPDIASIEIFSDGYPAIPEGIGAADWEAAFAEAERVDFHKTGAFATVKGSTGTEVFDDRTVLILSGL